MGVMRGHLTGSRSRRGRPLGLIRRVARGRLRGRDEAAVILGAYGVYNIVRAAFGGDLEEGRANARRVVALEERLGIAVERRWQAAFERRRLGMPFWSAFYLVSQIVALPLSVYLVHRNRPAAYPFMRNLALLAWSGGLVWYASQPVAPPRLLGDGTVDTVSRDTPINLESRLTKLFYNPIAAMPSLHVGLAPVVGGALALLLPRRLSGIALVGYPLLVTVSVIVTGNHYVLDVAGGVAVVAPAAAVAALLTWDDPRAMARDLRLGRTPLAG